MLIVRATTITHSNIYIGEMRRKATKASEEADSAHAHHVLFACLAIFIIGTAINARSEEHTSELQSPD